MHNTKSHLIVASALLLLFAAPACFADLMCYVCDNCQTVDKNTPLLACNEDFFNQGGSTEASTVTTTMSTITTTDEPTTIMPTTETPTTMPSDSTTVMDTTTTEQTTTDTTAAQTTEKTDAPMPTPATVGPPETTTSVPTPPNEDLLREVTKLVAVNGSPSGLADFTELPIRQRRALIDTNVSFHCYTVKKTVNNTAQTERGCSRVLASQSVCTDLREQSAPLEISYCDPCSMNACNSATSMMHTTMLSTFLIVLVAVVLQRK